MHKHLNTAALQLRLWVVTVLLAVLGFALVAEFSDHSGYSDDTVRVRVAEVVEYTGDGESPLTSLTPLISPPASMTIACVIPFALLALPRRRVIPRPVCVRHLHSRAPPALPQV
ncbi:hypothetical protein [Methylophilus sp. TWE2]|jgi:hypothetical protein|uniref:hypothetical protein n=1 Tax=Methylophilus sp. TWE2 TaxID=1662285 RepID=UPI0006713225|nr:hypothetical protein [Methylophilus sp. TWE2]AKR42196.1 hypothetical protein ACJ67_01185 [Methylophilus sp. TWE2]PPD11791.1 MAG: hypothetical protein CTY26_08100 [Methylophilus sp.]